MTKLTKSLERQTNFNAKVFARIYRKAWMESK